MKIKISKSELCRALEFYLNNVILKDDKPATVDDLLILQSGYESSMSGDQDCLTIVCQGE